MEGFTNTSEIEDPLSIASKDWNRIIEIAKKNGYREGLENGANYVFQEGFDKGYKEAFEVAFILGKIKSILNIIPQDVELPKHIKTVLDQTKRGACYMCMMQSEGKNDLQKSFLQIINEQRMHSLNIIQILYQYFQQHTKELNITKLDLLKMQNQIQELYEGKQLTD